MLLRSITAFAALVCCATVAHAGAVFGSSATSTFASPIVQQAGTDADMNDGPDGVAARFRNSVKESGSATFTVEWDVTGAEDNIKWRLFVLNRTTAQTQIVGLRIEDDSGNFATSANTFNLNTGPVDPGTITTFDLIGFQTQADYGSVDAGFDWTNVEGLLITFQLTNPVGTGNRDTINIDAVANPEPGTLALFGLGLLGLGAVVRRRRSTNSVRS
jgi:hypothetical protein